MKAKEFNNKYCVESVKKDFIAAMQGAFDDLKSLFKKEINSNLNEIQITFQKSEQNTDFWKVDFINIDDRFYTTSVKSSHLLNGYPVNWKPLNMTGFEKYTDICRKIISIRNEIKHTSNSISSLSDQQLLTELDIVTELNNTSDFEKKLSDKLRLFNETYLMSEHEKSLFQSFFKEKFASIMSVFNTIRYEALLDFGDASVTFNFK